MSAAAIALAGVAKTFATPTGPVPAVANVSVAVAPGEFVSVIGPSGCGKSTLLLMVAGLEPPSAGRVLVDGAPVSAPRPDVGLMFQDPTLLPWRSVLDNVLFPVRMGGRDLAAHRPRAEALLRRTGLWAFRDKRPRQLSGGMRQRVALCRALVTEPRILLMDEPFSALDAITRDDMAELLGELWETGPRTALFITHSIREAVFLSDRVLVMGPRPATVIEEVAIPFSRPRAPEIEADPRFAALTLHLKARVHEAMRRAA